MWRDVRSLLGGLEDAVHHINKEYFSFNIYRMTDYDSINHNVYLDSEQGQYEWHKDFSLDRMYDLKLTVIANISTTPYEGGKFELFVNEPLHIKEMDIPGSVLIFPSFLNHRVNPVTQGTRETISFWVPGPHFK
jgi:PKHD-type hydroxylase